MYGDPRRSPVKTLLAQTQLAHTLLLQLLQA
jgi:hypothetical protein